MAIGVMVVPTPGTSGVPRVTVAALAELALAFGRACHRPNHSMSHP
jgi:hypothetical protein